MNRIEISESKNYFMKDGAPFFYLADTVWSAFTNTTMDEWREYLEYRQTQGFNVLQISMLPITHDSSESILAILPFRLNPQGKMDFSQINDEYFERAEKMVEMAAEKGFVPALVVLWNNYVPDTWAAKRSPDTVMPFDAVKRYTEYVTRRFSRFHPIYIISGDTNFEAETVCRYYKTTMDIVKSIDPQGLTTMHLSPSGDIPDEILNSSNLDFYMYQSGHGLESQDNPYLLAEKFYTKPIRRPVVNGEPCYEGHGHGSRYGRFHAFDVRKAIWQSLLSGAKAGVTYGAHGIWSWHRKGLKFTSESFSGIPFDWKTALRLEGAWDASFAKWIFEVYRLFDLEPRDLIDNKTREIRMAASRDFEKVALYLPYSVEVKVKADLSGYEWIMIDLEHKRVAKPVVKAEEESTAIQMHDFNSDVILIGRHF